MAIDLPATPGPVEISIRQIDFGGTLTPGLGGPVQRINRNGNRFAVAVQMPPMKPIDARAWLAALNQGVQQGVRWRLRQVELFPGSPGTVRVNGGGQAGSTLVVDGANPNYPFRLGQFFSLVHNGQRYLHQLAAAVNANGSGQASLSIVPALRIEPADNDLVEIGQPIVEGLLADNGFEWSIDRARLAGISFTILERG